MKRVTIPLLVIAVFTFFGCKKNSLEQLDPSTNNVLFNLQLADELEMFKLKAGNGVAADDFLISVMDKDSAFIVRKRQLSSMPNGIYLDPGTYTAFAEYGDTSRTFAWNMPVYFGQATFDVAAEVVSNIQITASLTNTKVEVLFTDFLLDVYPDIAVDVCSDQTADCANFDPQTGDIGYFAATDAFTVTVSPNADSTHTHKISGVKPNMHYRLTFAASKQGAEFDISIKEEELIEITYNVPIDPGANLPVVTTDPHGITGKTFTGDLNLITQASIDNLAEQDFVIIDGNLTINGTALNTAGLETIKKVTGNLSIAGTADLSGLKNLVVVESSMAFSGTQDFSPLTHLQEIGGSLTINAATASKDCSGLDNLTKVGGNVAVYYQANMMSMKGLGGLTSVGGELNVVPVYSASSTALYDGYDRDFSEMKSIKSIGQLTIGAKSRVSNTTKYYSQQITALDGLENLETLNGFTITNPKAYGYTALTYYYVYNYCAVPVEIWENIGGYSNSTYGYKPPLATLQQGICRQ